MLCERYKTMSTIGISLYLEYYTLDECKKMIDNASKLGYKEIFTSFNFEEYIFPGARTISKKEKKALMSYAKKKHMTFHIDITRNLLYKMGGTVKDLTCFKDLDVPVIRLDGGFTPDEIAQLTKNKQGIMIEDNLCNYELMRERIKVVKKKGNLKQYSACLNFYPRNDTGLDLKDAVEIAEEFKELGCATGAFIGSLLSPTEMNDTGTGTPSIEDHRFLPSYIQMYELLCTKAFDFILFGDSNPTQSELEEVAHAYECFNKGYVELPCYLEPLEEKALSKIKELTYLSRVDYSKNVIRGTKARGIRLEPNNTIKREKYSVTMDNTLSNQYTGELQITLTDLPPARNVNVIGMVKPYARCLLPYIHKCEVKFKIK